MGILTRSSMCAPAIPLPTTAPAPAEPQLPAVRSASAMAMQRPCNAVARALRNEHRDPWADATEKDRAKAREEIRWCMAVADVGRQSGAKREEAIALVNQRSGAAGYPLLSVAGQHGKDARHLKNFENWMTLLGKKSNGDPDWDNVKALVSKRPRGRRERGGNPDFWLLLDRGWLTENQSPLADVYRDCVRLARMTAMPNIPTWRQVWWDKTHGNKLEELRARKGRKWTLQNALGWIERDWETLRVGELWIGDHRKLDFLIKWWNDENELVPMRIWVTMWRDARSGHAVAWSLYPGGEDPDSSKIIECLVNGMLEHGCLPVGLYIDNGKDFCARGFTEPVEITVGGQVYKHSVAQALGIEVVHAIKYNARAKPVERFFRDMANQYDRLFPSYIGNCPANRKEGVWDAAKRNVAALPSYQEAYELFELYLRESEENLTRSKITDGVPVAEAWAGRKALRPGMAPEELVLATLKTCELRTVRRTPDGPGIEYRGWYYSCPELLQHWDEQLLVKEDVRARMITRVKAEVLEYVYVFHPDGRLIGKCTAANMENAWARTDEERAALGEHMAKIRAPLRVIEKSLQERLQLPKPLASKGEAYALFLRERGLLLQPGRRTKPPAPIGDGGSDELEAGEDFAAPAAGAATSAPSASRQAQDAADPDTTARFAAFLATRGETATESLPDETLTSRLQAFVHGQNEEHETP